MESTKSLRGGSAGKLIAATALGMSLVSYQAVAGPSASLQQARNGPVSAPISPVEYVNGNVGSGNSHFVEGQSATYRAVMLELPINRSITITLGYDIKQSGRHAIDYLTGFNRLSPHYYPGHVSAEVIDPLRGLTGVPPTFMEYALPAPGSAGSPVPGMPTASFNKLPSAERMMRLYGGTITDIQIASSGDLSADSSEAQVSVTFTATHSSAVLAWGGHLASRSDWPAGPDGVARSAAGISGSPYHMRLIGWNLGNLGRQDRSMSADQVFPPPPPVFTDFPPDVTVSCRSEVPAPDPTLPKASDYCGGVTISHKGDVIESGACPDRYIMRRTYVATDLCGNSSEKTQVITVHDITPPRFVLFPDNVTVDCAKDIPEPDISLVSASDNCGGSVQITYQEDVQTSFTCENRYTIARTYVATDACGNSAEKTQVIKVYDITPPQFVLFPGNATVGCAKDIPEPDISLVSASDNCGGSVQITYQEDVQTSFTCENRYTIARTYVATDACGNSAEKTQVIKVHDITLPQFVSFPDNVTVDCAKDIPRPDISLVSASDTCGGPVQITYQEDVQTSFTCENRYTVERTYVATDVCGNSSKKTQYLTVDDRQSPSIVCPSDTYVYLDTNGVAGTDPAKMGEAVSYDTCGGIVKVTYKDSTVPGSGRLQYTIARTWTAEDLCGNSANCVQMIEVLNGAPEITLQPEGQSVPLGGTVTFCAAAAPLPPVPDGLELIYQWRHNGVNIEGATDVCLTIENASLSDGGTYTFLAANAVGVAVSDLAVLSINLPTIDVGSDTGKPSNDDFAGRIGLLGLKGTFASHNRKATFETMEPLHAGKKGGKSVWFTWKAPVTGVATIKTSGSLFDTLLGIYTGTALDKLETRGADEDTGGFYTSIARFNMIKGREYHVAVDGFAGQEGSFVFDYELIDKPHLVQVFPVQPLSQTVPEGSFVTFDPVAVRVCGNGQENCPNPAHYPKGELPTLSYQWYFEGEALPGATLSALTIPNVQPESAGRYQLCVYSKWETNCSAVAVLQVYSGEGTLPNVIAFDKLEDAENSPPLEITAGSEDPAPPSPGLISVQSTVVSGYSGTLVFNTTGSATSPLEIICGVIGGASQWVNFVPQQAGTLKLNTKGGTYDTVMALYRRNTTNPSILDLIACNNNASSSVLWAAISVPVAAGQTNFVLIDGVNGASGTLRLNYTNVVTTPTQ